MILLICYSEAQIPYSTAFPSPLSFANTFPFSSILRPQERNNLTNLSSYRYSGLVHKKTLAIVPADKTGFSVLYKKNKYQVSIVYPNLDSGM